MKQKLKTEAMLFPAPAFVVGTYDEEHIPDAMVVAWGGLCSSTPPCVMIAVREERYTWQNIQKRKAFTVNLPSEKNVDETDYFGLVSGKKARKFDVTGLSTTQGEAVDAPVIDAFPVALECKYVQHTKVGSHIMVIGEIVNILGDDSCLNEKGELDIHKMKPLVFNPAQNVYNTVGENEFKAFDRGKKYLKKN